MLIKPSNLKAETALHSCLPSARVVVRMRRVVYLFAVFRNQIGQVALVPVQELFNV